MTKKIRVNLIFDKDKWEAFKKMCKENDQTFSGGLENLIEQSLEKNTIPMPQRLSDVDFETYCIRMHEILKKALTPK